jgi:hypothetical protein
VICVIPQAELTPFALHRYCSRRLHLDTGVIPGLAKALHEDCPADLRLNT